MQYEFEHTLNDDRLGVKRVDGSGVVDYRFDFVMRNDSLVVNGDRSVGDSFDYSVYIGRVFKGDKGDKFTWDEVTDEEKTEMAESVVKPLLVDLVFKGTPVDQHIQSIDGTIPGRVASLEKRMAQIEDLSSSSGLLKTLEKQVKEVTQTVESLNTGTIQPLKNKVNEMVTKVNSLSTDYNDLEERVTVVEDKIEIFATEEDINGIIK